MKIDRRGFFASIGAALLAPLAPLVPLVPLQKKVGALRFSSIPKYDIIPRTLTLKAPIGEQLSLGKVANIDPFPYDSDADMFIPGLANFVVEDDDPLQTFQVNTNDV